MNNIFRRSLSLALALVMVLGMVPFGALRTAAAQPGDKTTTKTETPPADVPYGIWVLDQGTTLNPNPKATCGNAVEHTHSDSCYRKTCDHADGHISSCFSSSTSYALCNCEATGNTHTGTVTMTDVVTISGTNASWKTDHPAYSAVRAVYDAAYWEAYNATKLSFLKDSAGKAAGIAALAGKEFCYTVSASAEADLCTHTCSAVGGSCYSKVCILSEHKHTTGENGCYEYRWTLVADENDNNIPDSEENKFTVTYMANGAEFASFKDVVVDAATPVPTEQPTKQYYAFAGWGSVAATVTGDATYTAQWTPVKDEDGDGIADEEDTFIISWDTDGDGDVDETTELAYGENPENYKPEHAAKENYSPNGWAPAFVTVAGKKTYTAQYSQDTIYTITFKVDGTVYETQYVNASKGEKVADVAAPDKDYAVFGGWTNADVIGTTPTGDVTLDAQWLADINNNNVDDADETAAITVTIEGNGSVALAGDYAVITHNGDGSYSVVYDSTVSGGNVINVTATPADTNGTDGSVDYLVSAPETVTVEDGKTATVKAVFATETLTIEDEGDVFINGYKLTEKLDGLKEKVLDAAFGEGNYNADDYTVYMVLGSGNVDVESDKVLDKINMTARFNIGDKQGFIVEKVNAPVVSDTITVNVKDSRLTLQITTSDVSISEKAEPADVLEQVKAAVTIKATDPQTEEVTVVAVSDSYLTFAPSYTWPEDAGTGVFTVTVQVNSSANATYANAPKATLTLTCVDTTILYTVTYLDGMGNTLYSDKTAEFLPTPAIAEPTRTYYAFSGWTPTVADTVTGEAVYTATWTAVNDVNGNTVADEEEVYTVIYAPGYEGAETLATFENLNWGEATPSIPNPTREGYNFLGWDVTPAANVTAPASGNTITYTALWTELHAVIFIDRDNQDSCEVKDGETVSEPAAPVWDADHDFLGWYVDGEKYDFTAPVTKSLTLTAAWRDDFNHNDIDDTTEAHYTVIYVVNGEETKFENVLVDTATPTVADPTAENYKFAGWDPEVAEFVTGNATYTALFVNDTNNNGVDDALETVTVVVNAAAETDSVTLNGGSVTTYVYDSTVGATIAIAATPTTHKDGSTTVSDTYVAGIAVDGEAAIAVYTNAYAAKYDLVLPVDGGSKTVTVDFALAQFTWNDERIMNYYDGMTGIGTQHIYDVVASQPPFADADEVVIKYKARDAMSHTIYIDQLNISDLAKRVLKLVNGNSNEIVINMDTLWMDVNDQVKESVSLQQAVETYFTTEAIEGVFEAYTNAGGITGGMTSLNAAKAELEAIFTAITTAALYYGAHNFGYNNTASETVDELLQITYKSDVMYIEAEQTITLKDLRETSYVKGNNVSVMYKDYTDEELLAAIGATVTDADGNPIPGATAYSLDVQDPYTLEGRNVSDAAYEVTMKFAGNETYKPSQAVFTVTVTKAPASMDVPNVNVYYGESYSLTPNVTLGNAYGDSSDIIESNIQFIIGLDAADLDVNADGVTGINGTIQLRLPKELQDMLDMVTGSDSTGLTMSLSQLTEYLSLLEDSSVEALRSALQAITKITETGDIQITIGGDLPTDIGVYLHGSVSTNANYETAFDVGYLIIKPKATQVYLDFNYHDANGIITKDLLDRIDLGASAYDEAALETLNPAATELVQNLYFGLDEKGNLITSLDASTLGNGAYTQLSFIAEFGNAFYYAVPIVRAFVIVPNVTNVELVDAEGNAKDEFTFTFDNTPKNLYVRVDGEIVEQEILYYGVQTNTKLHKAEDGAPVHAGVYTATVTYVTYDENGEILSVGADMAVITIAPTESEISVTGGSVVYDGESHGATVEATSTVPGLKPDVTVISGTVLVDGDKDGIGLEDIQGVANIDFPAWLDAILSQRFEGAYASGVTVKDFSYKLEQYADKLIELGLTEEMVNSLRNLLKNLPENVTLTFNDNVTYTEVGAYVFLGVVTDSDHVPSMDTGLLLIQKADMEFDLLDTTVTYDGNEHFVDVTNPNNSDYLYVVIDRENNVGNIVLEDDLNDLLAILEDKLGRELPKSMDVGELMNAVDTILTEVESYEGLPVTAGAALTKLREVLAELPQSGTVTINGKNPVDVGKYEIYAITYSLEYATQASKGVLEILPIEIEVIVDNASKVYGETDPELTYSVVDKDGNAVDGVVEVTLTRAEGEDVGKYPIAAEVNLLNKNYKVVEVTEDAALTITPYAATVTVNDATKVYGETDPEFTYETTVDELIVTLEREQGEDVGEYAIKAIVAENPNYTVTVVDGTFTITPKAVTITAADATKVYGEADPELTTDCEIAELNAKAVREAGENVGEYAIKVEYTENANYTVTVVDGTFTITPKAVTITAADATKVFGEADPELTTDCEISELNAKAVREAGEDVGTYAIKVEYTENANYTVTTVDGEFTITPKAVTITANDATKVFGEADPTLTTDCEISELNAKAVREAGEDVGEYKITVEYTENANYTVTTVDGTFTITPKAVTITANDATKVFGEADPALTTDCEISELNAKAVRKAGENVGEYKITVEYTENANYTVTTVDGTFTITPKAVTITAADATKVFGEADPALTTDCTISELNAKAVREAGEDVGEYKITVEYTENANYTVTTVDGTFTITPKAVTITAADAAKVFGEADPALTTDCEIAELNAKAVREAGENVGTYAIKVEYTENANYTVTTVDGEFTITPKAVTITAADATKVFGEADPTLTTDCEIAELNAKAVREAGEDVGTYAIKVEYTENANYTVTTVDGTFTITPKAVTITAADATKVFGEADPTLTTDCTIAELNAKAVREAGEDVGTYTIKVEYTENANYTVTTVDGTFTITPKAVTITAADATKVFGEADPTLITDCEISELNAKAVREAGEDVGTYTIKVEYTENANYTVTTVDGTFTITPKAVTIAAADATKVFGETDPALTTDCTIAELNAKAVREAGENVGEYAIKVEYTENANYTVTTVDGTFTITPKAVTITAADATKVFGETDPALTTDCTIAELNAKAVREAGENVGEYAIKVEYTENANYTVTTVDGTFTITPKAVTITAADATKVFGEADPALTTDCEISELNAKAVREAGENVGEYKITVEYTENANYTVTTVDGEFTITPKAVTITAADATKVFGEADPELTTDCTVAELNAKAVREAGENVGEYKITVEYTENANYTVTTIDGTFTITPKAVTITAADATKVFGEADPALTTDCTVAELNAKAVREAGEDVGEYKITVEYTENPNYVVTVTDGSKLTITQRSITVKLDDVTIEAGDALPTFTYTITDGELPEGGSLDLTITTDAEDTNTPGAYTITAQNNDPNYAITVEDATLTIEDSHAGLYPIYFDPAADDTGTIIPGSVVEIDGVPYVLDDDTTVWVPHTTGKLATTYKYKVGESHYETYPTNMYVWILKITDTDGDGEYDLYTAERVKELDDFMLYAGTSIRINSNPGIRFFTTVPADKFQALMDGKLLTGELAGFKMVRSGTLYVKWREETSNLIMGVGVSSDVYGGAAGDSFRRFSTANGRDWFTGMLTNLPDDPETLSMDILSRPYVVLERDGEQIVIYGGTVRRSVYYVATQNRDVYEAGTAYDNYIENIITIVENAKNG